MRPIAHKGDRTTTGGTVITGCDKALDKGRPIARLGDKATCAACGETGTIAEGDPKRIVGDSPVALHLHIVACGCPYGSNRIICTQNEAAVG